jgi:hypothetical protein
MIVVVSMSAEIMMWMVFALNFFELVVGHPSPPRLPFHPFPVTRTRTRELWKLQSMMNNFIHV